MYQDLEILSLVLVFAVLIWLAHLAWSALNKRERHAELMKAEATKISLLQQLVQNAGLPLPVANTPPPPPNTWVMVRRVATIVFISLIALVVIYLLFSLISFYLITAEARYNN